MNDKLWLSFFEIDKQQSWHNLSGLKKEWGYSCGQYCFDFGCIAFGTRISSDSSIFYIDMSANKHMIFALIPQMWLSNPLNM